MKKVSLWQLFIAFFKIGAFTFGGGYAMIAVIEQALVENKKWITSEFMMDMVVVAESTPGVIAVNMATGVGYQKRGVIGAIVATLGVVLPSFLLICGVSFVIDSFGNNYWYKAAFAGIRCCVVVLIFNAFVKLGKQVDKNLFNLVLVACAFGVSVFTNFNVIYLIMIGAVVGVVFYCCTPIGRKLLPPANQTEEEVDK